MNKQSGVMLGLLLPLAIGLGFTAPATAQVSSNIGVVSNYLFRGVSQTDDGAAIQGGLDWENESGLYFGTWLSNVDFGGKEDAEVDLYAGFGNEFGDSGISYDIGTIYYLYPGGGDLDYAEAYFGLGFGAVSASVAYTYWGEVSGASAFDTGDLYYNISADLPISLEKFSLSVFAGYYDFDEDGNPDAGDELSYGHWGISLGRDLGDFGTLSLTYEQTDGGDRDVIAADDKPNLWLGWTLEF
ncbi:MAG: TorF family putative porin [Wenzhouxiangellaceae bacterium]|nr:TorF family putative porin [Wenzhouxiangellaceae bacterium]